MIGLALMFEEVAPFLGAAFAAGAVMVLAGGLRLAAARWSR